jgi:hypothetical protein
MDEIPVRVHVSRLFCYFGADEWVSEPYLWVIGFKLDGSTITQQLARLNWTPDFFFSAGSQGCLGRDFRPGTAGSVPAAVGRWETSVKPIKLTDLSGATTDVPGAIGFAAVLMEENNVPASAAEAGHQALNGFVASKLEEFITAINLVEFKGAVDQRVNAGAERNKAIEDELRARFETVQQALSNEAPGVVEQAIRNDMNLAEAAWAGVDKDEVMGRAFHLATTSQLLAESNFMLEYRDHVDDNPIREAGRWAYNLDSSIKARVRRRYHVIDLPAAHDIEIQGIEQRFSRETRSQYISRVGGIVDGNTWSITRSKACDLIDTGAKAFYVSGADGARTPVLTAPGPSYWRMLITPSDADPRNNLLSLPRLTTVPGYMTFSLEFDPSA